MVITNILKSKSFLVIALLVTLSLCIFACGKKGAQPSGAETPAPVQIPAAAYLVGIWGYEVPELGEVVLELRQDGTGSSGTANAMIDIMWDADDATISTTVDGNTSSSPYTLTETTLTVTTEEGSVTYTRKG